MDELKSDANSEVREPQPTAKENPKKAQEQTQKKTSEVLADEGRAAPKGGPGDLGQIPVISRAIAARRVKTVERKVGKFLTEATAIAAKVSVACAKKV